MKRAKEIYLLINHNEMSKIKMFEGLKLVIRNTNEPTKSEFFIFIRAFV